MANIMYYGFLYFIEALIIWQYCSFMFPAKYSRFTTCIVSIPLYAIAFAFSLQENVFINIFLFIVINFAYIFLTFKSSWYTAIFHASIATVIMSLSELISMALFSQLTYAFYSDILIPQNLVVLAILSKLLYFIILQIIALLFGKAKEKTTKFNSIIPILTLIVISTEVTLVTFALICAGVSLTAKMNHMIGVSSLLLLLINIIIIVIYDANQKKSCEFTQLQIQYQKEYDSAQYYKMLSEQHENQSILIHDIKKHLNSIATLNEQGDSEKVASYITQIIASPALQENIRICDNQMLNIVLSRYQRSCRESNIKFHPDVRSNSIGFLPAEDLTALFCNLLDNSVEAADKQNDSYIELSVSQKEDTPFTIINVINSCRTNPFSPEDGRLISRKPDSMRHGYGIKSIKHIVKKYNGEMQMYYDEDTLTFHTIILLKNEDTH